ncbi:unnamed protein product [Pleuronectes platessa]|uniref:Uncharacterized protein n=1 Tax=Pleuronectes platessa TaxID=8262 RepID=A0A9N7TXD5_PLEPL|nr:unnamed protein product [Pleuronectes platessa]
MPVLRLNNNVTQSVANKALADNLHVFYCKCEENKFTPLTHCSPATAATVSPLATIIIQAAIKICEGEELDLRHRTLFTYTVKNIFTDVITITEIIYYIYI